MGKTKTFAEKMIKSKGDMDICPVCDSAFQSVRTMTPIANAETGYFKFRDCMVKVCKCNHKEVYES